MRFQAACNRTVYACGCTSWLELERGQWVLRSYPCNRHDGEGRAMR